MNKIKKIYLNNKQFIHYCIISFLCTIILYLVYFIVNYISNNQYILANFFGYLISFTLLFILDQKLFKSKPKDKKILLKQVLIFIFIRAMGFLLESMILIILIEKLKLSNLIAKLISSTIIFIYNYLANKKYVFIKEKSQQSL